MSPRARKQLDPRSKDFKVRFAIHLRGLLAKRKMTAVDFLAALERAGLKVAAVTVRKWLSGENVPQAEDFEAVASALGIRDYRHALPPPKRAPV